MPRFTLRKELWNPLLLQSHRTFVYLQTPRLFCVPHYVFCKIDHFCTQWPLRSQWLFNYNRTPRLCLYKASQWFSIESVITSCWNGQKSTLNKMLVEVGRNWLKCLLLAFQNLHYYHDGLRQYNSDMKEQPLSCSSCGWLYLDGWFCNYLIVPPGSPV